MGTAGAIMTRATMIRGGTLWPKIFSVGLRAPQLTSCLNRRIVGISLSIAGELIAVDLGQGIIQMVGPLSAQSRIVLRGFRAQPWWGASV